MAAEGGGAGVPLVLVTGASGFIASHIVRQLLAAGYRVRGSVRDASNPKKTTLLKSLPGAAERLALVSLDLESDAGWEEACAGVEYVLHTASPVGVSVKEADIEVAVQGTMRAVRAGIKAKVKRIVLTSSIAAVAYGHPAEKTEYGTADFSVVENTVGCYQRSKTLAEQAAWEAVEEDGGVELASILPSAVLGPSVSLHAPSPVTSQQFVFGLISGKFPGIPDLRTPFVDVRDVARAHIRAMTVPEAAGKRFLLTERGEYTLYDLATTLKTNFPTHPVPTSTLPNLALWFASFFDADAGFLLPDLSRTTLFDASATKDILGVDIRRPDSSAIQTASFLIAAGKIPKRKGDKVDDTIDERWTVPLENIEQIKL